MLNSPQISINKEIREKVLLFGRLLQEDGIHITNLVIFGSYAKNIPSEWSDIDVCVVSPDFGKDHMDEHMYLFKKRRSIDSRIEPYPASLEEFNALESPLMYEIQKFGIDVAGFL